jgi:trigger factor
MKSELLGQEKNNVRIKVEFEPEEFTASLAKTLQEMSLKASIPGFRKGRVPRKVLEMRFGKDGLYGEAVERMLPPAVEQVVGDYDLHTISGPSLNLNLEEIEVEKLRPKVTDEMIAGVVANYRKQHSTLESVERAAEPDDVVLTDCVYEILGEEESSSPQET